MPHYNVASVPHPDLGRGELGREASVEVRQLLILQPTEDEDLVLHKEGKVETVHTEQAFNMKRNAC